MDYSTSHRAGQRGVLRWWTGTPPNYLVIGWKPRSAPLRRSRARPELPGRETAGTRQETQNELQSGADATRRDLYGRTHYCGSVTRIRTEHSSAAAFFSTAARGSGTSRNASRARPRSASEHGFGEHLVRQGPVAAGREVFDPVLREDPSGVLGDGLHEGIGLVGAPPGKTLLGPAAGSRPRLDVARAGLGRQHGAGADHSHRISAAADQDGADAPGLPGQGGQPGEGVLAAARAGRPRATAPGGRPRRRRRRAAAGRRRAPPPPVRRGSRRSGPPSPAAGRRRRRPHGSRGWTWQVLRCGG